MTTQSRDDAIALAYRRPVELARAVGYTELTDLHNGWIRRMVFGEGDETIQGHRGSYKTTCLGVAFSLILTLLPSLRIIFIRKTDEDVAEVMTATATLLKHPVMRALSAMLYGFEVEVVKDTQSCVDTNLKQGVSAAPQLLGLGLGSSLTGKHADRVFTDDIVNLKDRVSPAERERTKLVYQELQNVKNRGGRIVNTGTPWHKDDCFTLMPNISRFDCYSTGLMDESEIEHQRQSMSRSLFCANYELKHVADGDAMFSDPQYFSDYELIFDGIGHIDAAYGGADGTAFTAMAEKGGKLYAYGRLWQEPVDKVLGEILALAKRLRVGTIYTEQNADKGYLRRDILKRGHPAASYPESMNKFIKISTYLKGRWGDVMLLDSEAYPADAEYVGQVLDYNEFAQHDDAPDSLACAVRVLSSRPGIQGFREGI